MEHLTIQLLAFAITTIPVAWISWRSIRSVKNHGFYRFLAWECILWLFILQVPGWFREPFTWHQIISWILLFGCCYPVLAAVYQLKKAGKANKNREDSSLYTFERTTSLVTTGIFRYIRHPMYTSLMLLAWGIAMKQPTIHALLVALLATVLMALTGKMEEAEDIAFFGDAYREYMKRSKRFIPWIF